MASSNKRAAQSSGIPNLRISIHGLEGEPLEYLVREPSSIGRDENCPIHVEHHLVSRAHAEVFYESGQWWLRDCNSTNGTYVQGQRIETVRLASGASFSLGMNGPECFASIEAKVPESHVSDRNRVSEYEDYYLKGSTAEGAGERTIFIREAFRAVQQRHRRRNRALVASLLILLLVVGSYALYQRSRAGQQEQLAQAMFYSLKDVELQLARAEEALTAGGTQGLQQIRDEQARRNDLEAKYDQFVKETRLYTGNLSEEDRLILRVTRVFGECEIGMPPNYVSEIKRYIGFWKKTDRLKNAITRAESRGYTIRIASAMLKQGLPPQFFYLALQESDFDPYAVGPPTRMGIAKGMWQFIPETASKYGLRVGPLYDVARVDPDDERADFQKSTEAAARYLKFIYTTDAQASGLLVMASYNWGEGRVVPMIRRLPASPKYRNFWRLLAADKEKVPEETYNYVFHIVSAAVIGENPRLFGFDFDNPLRHLDRRAGL